MKQLFLLLLSSFGLMLVGSILGSTNGVSSIGFLLFIIGSGMLYFTPSIIAYKRQVQTNTIFVINFFLGWTLLGWVVSLAWALSDKK